MAYKYFTYVGSKKRWVGIRISERSAWYVGLFVKIREVGYGWLGVIIIVREGAKRS